MKSFPLVLLLSLSLFALTLAAAVDGSTGDKPKAQDTDKEEDQLPCPVEQCEADCTAKCMRGICPAACELDPGVNSQNCDRGCKNNLIRNYFTHKRMKLFEKTHDGQPWSHYRGSCPYDHCIEEAGECDWDCVKEYCPDECKDPEMGECPQGCKFTAWHKIKRMKVQEWLQEHGDEMRGHKADGMRGRTQGDGMRRGKAQTHRDGMEGSKARDSKPRD